MPQLELNYGDLKKSPATGVSINYGDLKKSAGPPKADENTPLLTTSVVKMATGKGASDVYDSFSKKFPWLDSSYVGKLTREVIRAGPEIADAATSPAGLALVGAHLFPYTRPIAMAADVALGATQIAQTVPDVIKASKDMSPENVASVMKDLFYSYGLIKSGKKSLPTSKTGEMIDKRSTEGFKKLAEVAPKPGDKPKVKRMKMELRDNIVNSLSQPASKSEASLKKVYNTPIVKTLASMTGVKMPTIMQMGRTLVDQRDAFINTETARADKLHFTLTHTLNESDRDVTRLGYVLQKDATPEEVGLSREAEKMIPAIDEFREHEAEMLRTAYGRSIPLQDAKEYLAQIWDFDAIPETTEAEAAQKGAKIDRAAKRLMKDVYLKERKIFGYKEGIEELGLTPKYNDVADILRVRHRTATQAVANQTTANNLKDMGLIMSEKEAGSRGKSHWPIAEDATPLDRAAWVGGDKKEVIDKKTGKTIVKETEKFTKQHVRVHPDIKPAVDAIFAKGFDKMEPGSAKLKAYGAHEAIRSFIKQNALMMSLFHNIAISEQSQALKVGSKSLGKAATSFFFLPFGEGREFYKGVRSGLYDVVPGSWKRIIGVPDAPPVLRRKWSDVEPWLKSDLRPTSSDAETKIVKTLRGFVGKSLIGRAAAPALRRIGDIQHIANRALWDYYFPGSMFNSAESILAHELKSRPNATVEEVSKLRRDISQHVNTAFGSENTERLLLHPKTVQAMHALLFAPAWTLSNIRILTSGFENESQRKLRNKWVIGAALSWFITTQLTNYALSSWYSKDHKGWFSWDNPGSPMVVGGKQIPGLSENSINIYAGRNDDGSQRYIKFGRSYREPFLWLTAPIETLGGKIAQIPKAIFTLTTGHEPGSGYEVVSSKGTTTTKEKWIQRTIAATNIFIPFAGDDLAKKVQRMLLPELVPVPTTSQYFSLPVTKGLSKQRAIAAYAMAMNANRKDVAKAVLDVATINNIPIKDVISGYRRDLGLRKATKRGPIVRTTTPPDFIQ